MCLRETMSWEDFAAECRDIDNRHLGEYHALIEESRFSDYAFIPWQKAPEPVFYPYFIAISGIIKFLQERK